MSAMLSFCSSFTSTESAEPAQASQVTQTPLAHRRNGRKQGLTFDV